MNEDLHDLVDRVITQIRRDFAVGDRTAVEELLMAAPTNSIGSLPPRRGKHSVLGLPRQRNSTMNKEYLAAVEACSRKSTPAWPRGRGTG